MGFRKKQQEGEEDIENKQQDLWDSEALTAYGDLFPRFILIMDSMNKVKERYIVD